MKYQYTLITSVKPAILSKSFNLKNGELVKTPGGVFLEGNARKREETLQEFVETLKSLDCHQALCYGLPKVEGDYATVTLRELKGKTTSSSPIIAHIKDDFEYQAGPGLMLGDVDFTPFNRTLTVEEIKERLYDTVPALRDTVPHVISHSASSWILNEETSELIKGESGKHFYFAVKDAREIPAIGERLFELLWLKGYGYNYLKSNGVWEPRALLDRKVWYESCYDFAGGAWCDEPLIQRRPDPILINPDGEPLALDMLDVSNKKRVTLMIEADQEDRESERAAKEEDWLSKREHEQEDEYSKRGEKFTEAKRKEFREHVKKISEDQLLLLTDVIYSKISGVVTVKDILVNKDNYHETLFKDPPDPEYNGGEFVAKAYLMSKFPFINSFRSGTPTRYYLGKKPSNDVNDNRDMPLVRLVAGKLVANIDDCIKYLKADGEAYDRGGALSIIHDGKIMPLSSETLRYFIQRVVRFEKWSKSDKDWIDTDLTLEHSKAILKLGSKCELPKLNEIITLPTILTDGRIIEKPGYHEETGLFLDFNGGGQWSSVGDNPTEKEVKQAVARLWKPFSKFPFKQNERKEGDDRKGNVCRGAFLSAVLSTAASGFLKLGIGIDATEKGSGKSLLSFSLQHLSGGDVEVIPPKFDDEPEMKKTLTTLAMTGSRVVVMDNIDEPVKSAALCAFLTSDVWSDRILGGNTKGSWPNNVMMVFTGNNLTVKGDLNRRLLRATIDTQVERPWEREFDFNPLEYVKEHLLELRHCCLTILRAAQMRADKPKRPALGSYEAWSNFIRDAVCWIGEQGWLDVGDPALTITQGFEDDPERIQQAAVLETWHKALGNRMCTAKSITQKIYKAKTDPEAGEREILALSDALDGVEDIYGDVSAKSLSTWIRKSKLIGKIINGYSMKVNKQYTALGARYFVEKRDIRGNWSDENEERRWKV